MTNNKNEKFTLVTKEGREPVVQQNGRPFEYSTRDLAKLGKRALENDRKAVLVIVTA